MRTSKYWIDKLNLQKHPEGGWFKEVYRSEMKAPENVLTPNFGGVRNLATSIYYLLENKDFSAWHKIKSDEIWHYYTGNSTIEILSIENNGIIKRRLGPNPDNGASFQVVIPSNTWFAARLLSEEGFALAGCTVSPGFHFSDFILADESLINEFPDLKSELIPFLAK